MPIGGSTEREERWTLNAERSGGAGTMEHFAEVFGVRVDAALAASVFHSGAIAIPELKRFLRDRAIEVRP